MPWRPLKDIAYAICIANFVATEPQDLSLELGDQVYIVELNGPWCRGWLLSRPSLHLTGDQPRQKAYAGIFPRTHVRLREVLSDDTAGSHEPALQVLPHSRRRSSEVKPPAPFPPLQIGKAGREPLVGDIPSSVNEWRSTRLGSLALDRSYQALEDLSALVDSLDRYRRDLSHANLTRHELHNLRLKTTWDLVQGSKAVDGQVIVRDPNDKGRIVTAKDDIVETLRLQAAMSMSETRLPMPAVEAGVYHLSVSVDPPPRAFPEPAILHMYLCAASRDRLRVLSETFDVDLPDQDGLSTAHVPEHLSRTLFTNIAKADVDSDEPLYLICSLSTEEPVRNSDAPSSSAGDSLTDSRSNSISLMSRRRGSDAVNAALGPRPSTAASFRSKFQRPPSSTTSRQQGFSHAANEQRLRRAMGWTALRVDTIMAKKATVSQTMHFWSPSPDSTISIDSDLQNVLDLLCNDKNSRYAEVPFVTSFGVSIQTFAHNDVNALVYERPVQLRGIHHTPSLYLFGKEPRSHFYITLREPLLPYRAKLFHPDQQSIPIKSETDNHRNLQVTLELRSDDGTRVEDSISPSANGTMHTAFRTWAIERGEAWNQTLRISLPSDLIPKFHIVMSIADGANFPFALAWYPLWTSESGFSPDGPHHLALWDYCEQTVSRVDGRGSYQNLSALADDINPHEPNMAGVVVETYLSSTFTTQNATVLALLHGPDEADLLPLLQRFHTVPDFELVKFFSLLLQILDDILTAQQIQDDQISEVTLSVVQCTTTIYSLLRDFRYPHLHTLLDEHIRSHHVSVQSRLQTVRTLRKLLSNPFGQGRELRAALKVTDNILKAVVAAPSTAQSSDIIALRLELGEFFDDLAILLQNTNQMALPTQVVIVQCFPIWLAQVESIITADQALNTAISMIEACSVTHPQLRLQRLSMIHQVTGLEMFAIDPLQAQLTILTAQWLSPYWAHITNVDEKECSAVRLCCTIIKEQRPRLNTSLTHSYVRHLFESYNLLVPQTRQRRQDKGPKRTKFTPLFPSSYPFQTYTVKTENVPSEVLLEVSALIGAFFKDTTSNAASTPLDDDFAEIVLDTIRSIQQYEAFPATWLTMIVAFSQSQLVIHRWLLQYMARGLPEVPETEDVMRFSDLLWTKWFEALSSLVTSQAVTMEYQSDQKRRAVWTIGGDVRQLAADLLHQAWQALGWENNEDDRALYGLARMGGYQVHFTSSLVPSIVAMGLSLHTGLRRTAIETLRSMIIGEWQLSGALGLIQSALTDSFDNAFRNKLFEPSQAVVLLHTLETGFASLEGSRASDLHAAVVELLSSTSHLVELLSLVHADGVNAKSLNVEHQVELIRCLQALDSERSFIRHVHDVAAAQIEARNYASAALTLQMHVDLNKTYDSNQNLEADSIIGFPAQTVSQRQGLLLSRIFELYGQSHCWYQALATLDDKLTLLTDRFDSAGLESTHREQADVYNMLQDGNGFKLPRYFRVTFGSLSLTGDGKCGKTFIYETGADEDTESFAKRMHRQFPLATIVHPGVTAPKETDSNEVVRISNVNINRDFAHPVSQQSGVSPFFRSFQLNSNACVFSTSIRQEKPGQSASEATVTKTVYWTEERFPTLLGRSEVARSEQLILSPVQAAIERTYRKTMDLAEANLAASRQASTIHVDHLIRHVKNSVDAGDDSVVTYRRLMAGPSTGETEGEDPERDESLLRALEIALGEHARAIEQALQMVDGRPEQKRQLRDKFEEAFEPELYAMYPSGLWKWESPVWTVSLTTATEAVKDDGAVDEHTDTESDVGRRPSWRRRRSSSIRTRLSFLGLGKGTT